MKSGIILLLIIVSFLSSCSKTYTCTCQTNGTTTIEVLPITNTKKKATKLCKAAEGTTKTCVLEY
jgi:predicted permease